MKTLKTVLALVAFLVVAGIIAAVGGDRLPQTSKIDVSIDACRYSVEGDLKVKKDQNVSLSVSSQEGGELHLHGYDLTQQLQPGKTETINFRAVRSGVFDLELHGCDDHLMLIVLNQDGIEPSVEEHESTEDHQPEAESKQPETEPHTD